MLVYGDHEQTAETGDVLARIRALHAEAATTTGIERHHLLVRALILSGQLLQGVADAEAEEAQADQPGPATLAITDLLRAFARQVLRSWDGDVTSSPLPFPDPGALPTSVRLRRPEGFAFYVLYPEAYAIAARRLPEPPAVVLGLRSIGTTLGAIVAEATGADLFATLRPAGDPFDRTVRSGPRLVEALVPFRDGVHAVVDEGPGLSGSSFGATADWLEQSGVPSGKVVFLPGHAGDLGPQAKPEHRNRWARATRPVVGPNDIFGRDWSRLLAWTENLTGPAIGPVLPLDGGRWRDLAKGGETWPADPQRERMKLLVTTASGRWLLKFAGLDEIGAAALDRARTLAEAGFGVPPAGYRHGFLVEPWLDDARPLGSERARNDPAVLDHVARYLAFRSRAFPAGLDEGASAAELLAMIRRNAGLALGETAGEALAAAWQARVGELDRTRRRVMTDNRLHRREWLVTSDGRFIKTDAVDHAFAHDLVGCQDIAWDMAGTAIEFGWPRERMQMLAARVDALGGGPLCPAWLDFAALAYPAFQIGLATMARDGLAHAPAERTLWDTEIERYETALRRELARL
jgi:hypothetical protein